MRHAIGGNGHAVTVHAEFEASPPSAANLLRRFRYRLQNNRTVRRARDTVGRAAHYVHDHSAGNIASEFGRMVRRNPGTALLVAAVAGFVIGRSIRRR